MLADAIRNAHAYAINSPPYLSFVEEARAIRQHMAAVRERLKRHQSEHGC
jgi:hypothetical protein